MNKEQLNKILYTGLLAAINIVGAYFALSLKLPIYLDCIGTIFSASLFGPIYGAGCALVSSLISGISDYYALFFIPSAISIGILSGIVSRKIGFSKGKIFLSTLIITLVSSTISTIISAYVFGGVTSSGSSYIVQFLKLRGLSLELSVFLSQVFSDYLDKFISILIVVETYKRLPKTLKRKLGHEKI